jgi:cellobiose-specific phosphotransferase system component IIB
MKYPISKSITKQQDSKLCGTSIKPETQTNGAESPEKHLHVYCQNGANDSLFQQMVLRKLDIHVQKKNKLDLYLIPPYTKINSKQVKDLGINANKPSKVIERNSRRKLQTLDVPTIS